MFRINRLCAALAAAAAMVSAAPADADSVRIVVPFAAGGPVDMVARLLAQELRRGLAPMSSSRTAVVPRGRAGGLGSRALARRRQDPLPRKSRRFRHQCGAAAADRIRSAQVVRADRAGRIGALAVRGAVGSSRAQPCRADRQGEAGNAHELRFGRRRHDHAASRRSSSTPRPASASPTFLIAVPAPPSTTSWAATSTP